MRSLPRDPRDSPGGWLDLDDDDDDDDDDAGGDGGGGGDDGFWIFHVYRFLEEKEAEASRHYSGFSLASHM